ncbi:MAG: ATPase, T2SS/T4P/T4SS family [Clostridia bacterium]|jgi:pilus assembly protein CpaF
MNWRKVMEQDYNEIIKKCLDGISGKEESEIEKTVTEYVYGVKNKDMPDKPKVIKEIMDSITGYGILQPLMEKEGITEIMINSGKIFYEEKGIIHRYEKKYSKQDIDKLITILCRKTDRTINMANPILDGSIGYDTRVNIILEPIANNGSSITIRRFPKKKITHEDMIKEGFFTQEISSFLEHAVKKKLNIFICGGAGSGKTTLLNVMTGFIPNSERVITIEDSMELKIDRIDNIIRLTCRNPNSEGQGEVGIDNLIRASLRMRPDRIIVGEIRGKEALYMLQAMNTGHIGSISTGHANSCQDAFSRIETMVLMECDMPFISIQKQIFDAIDIVISLQRINGRRVLTEITQVIGFEKGEISLNSLYKYDIEKERHIKINDMRKRKNEI